jgi:hypothetical protein
MDKLQREDDRVEIERLRKVNAALLGALEEVEIHYLPKGCEYQPTGKSCADTPAFAPCSPCKARAAIALAKEGTT